MTALAYGRDSSGIVVTQGRSAPLRFGVLATHTPTMCGVANFSGALCDALQATGASVEVVRVADGQHSQAPRVVAELTGGSTDSIAECAALLNQCDVAIIHHDTGVYGGDEGSDLVAVMRLLEVPAIVVAHAVPRQPSHQQRAVFEEVLHRADRIVVVSDAVGDRLRAHYDVWRGRVKTIPHGVTLAPTVSAKRSGRPTLLTWGLLRPGKGIERVIDAMATLREVRGQPKYVIAGKTHPRTLATDGESYRTELSDQVQRAGLGTSVGFEPDYRGPGTLAALVQSCAAVVLPYDSTDQVTSGVLVQAVASGRPVVATAFPHAIDVLGSGAGILVAHDDTEGLTAALRSVLTDPRLSGAMAAEGRRLAPSMAWSVVAEEYATLATKLVREKRTLA